MPGRKSKLTPETHEKIVAAIRAGSYIETAAAFAGVSKQTLYTWLRLGARSKGGPKRRFCEAVHQALAASEVRDVTVIGKAAETQWQAAAWRLERKFPARWAPQRGTARLQRDKLRADIALATARAAGLAPPDITVTVTDPAQVDALFRQHFGDVGARALPAGPHDPGAADRVRDVGEPVLPVPAPLDR